MQLEIAKRVRIPVPNTTMTGFKQLLKKSVGC